MKQLVWTLLLLSTPSFVIASTFVGNGGGQGDVELSVTLRQLEETYKVINEMNEPESLCACNPVFEGHSVCENLKDLSLEQKLFCGQTLTKKSSELSRLLRSQVCFTWTHTPISVQEGNGERAVDAVTDPAKKTITINLPRFLEMRSYERVYLIAHELMHLTSIDENRLVDEGPIGPFNSPDGGREFLNAMGSGVAVLRGERDGIGEYRPELRRSQSWKHFWFDYSGGGTNRQTSPDVEYGFEKYSGSYLQFRYAFEDFTLGFGFRSEDSAKTYLETIRVRENVGIASLSAGYRFFPRRDPLSFWGQSHFLFQASIDLVKSELSMKDESVEFKKDASTTGYGLSAAYYIPITYGFWGFMGAGVTSHPYKFKDTAPFTKLKYEGLKTNSFIGVSYAF